MRSVRGAGRAVGVVLLVALMGCGAPDEKVPGGDGAGGGGGVRTATGELEQLAARVRCRPDLQTDAEELRQANCRTADGRFVLLTFRTDRGQREWLDAANDYGGTYLVGTGAKWVVVGEEEVVTALRGQLGGTVERTGGSGHHGHDAS